MSAHEKAWVIAIDGPAGAGKSTVARTIAKHLDYTYIDTGAIYRCVALKARDLKLLPADFKQGSAEDELLRRGELDARLGKVLDELLSKADCIRFVWAGEKQDVFLSGRKVTDEIREEAISQAASSLSGRPIVREQLLEFQRLLGKNGRVVLEGRDIGTVVFPNADLKIFLNAALEERASRRYRESQQKGKKTALKDVQAAILERDRQDTQRAIAPLKKADDALEIDSTRLSIEQVVSQILDCMEVGKKPPKTRKT